MLKALDLRYVRVSVDDGVAVREPSRQPRLAASVRSRHVHHADAHPSHLDDALVRERLLHLGLVHVPVDSLDRRPERAELFEERGGDEVAGVKHEIGAAQQPDALVRQRSAATREMRVGEHGDAQGRRPCITGG